MIAIGADHGGVLYKEAIKNKLNTLEWKDYGAFSQDAIDYPDVAFQVAEDVACGKCEKGILICKSGVGMCMAANKVLGIRAALCFTPKMAEMAKKHEDANILAIGAEYTSLEDSILMIQSWLNSSFEGGRHQRRIDKVKQYEILARK